MPASVHRAVRRARYIPPAKVAPPRRPGYANGRLNAQPSQNVSWWRWPTVVSLDAPLVTMAWEWLFAREAGARLTWPHYAIVGATIWLAYAADRWFESWRVPPDRLITLRHRFHFRHQGAVAVAWIVVLAGAVTLSVFGLTWREWAAGLCLALPAVAYVLSHQLVHRDLPWRVPKELCIAALLTAGAALFPWVDARTAVGGLVTAAAWFLVLAFTNCALISLWERTVDREHGQDSLVRNHPAWAPSIRALPWLSLVFCGFLLLTKHLGSTGTLVCVAVSAGLLGIIDRLESRLGWAGARLLADAALLTPAAWLAGAWIQR